METNGRPVNVACNVCHTSSTSHVTHRQMGVHVCQCVYPLSRSSGSVSTVTESISIKHLCSQSIGDCRFWIYQQLQLSLWTLVSLVMSIHLISLMIMVSLIVIFTALSRKSSPRAAAQQLAKSITWAITTSFGVSFWFESQQAPNLHFR